MNTVLKILVLGAISFQVWLINQADYSFEAVIYLLKIIGLNVTCIIGFFLYNSLIEEQQND